MSAGQEVKPGFVLSCAKVRGNRANTSYPDDREIHTLADLLEAARFDHTPGGFVGGQRSKENWRCTEVVVLDVDNDKGGEIVTPEKICQDFPDVAHYTVYSRHHMQVKDGKPAVPRFHVYFPVFLQTDADKITQLLDDVAGRYSYFDDNCKDLARFFFGTENPQGKAVPGALTLAQFMEQQAALPAPTAPHMGKIPTGARNATLSAFAFTLLRKHGPEGIAEAEHAFLQRTEDCTSPLSNDEVKTIWKRAVKAAPAKVWNQPGYLTPAEYAAQGFPVEVLQLNLSDLSEVAEGTLFAENVTGLLLHCDAMGWLTWDGCRFAPKDSTARLLAQTFTERQLKAAGAALQQAAGTAAANKENAGFAAAEKKARDLLKFVGRCRSSSGITHLLTEAAPHLAVPVEALDADPFALNTPAGLVDLRTGKLRPSDPEARCTKVTAVAPGSDGAELWRSFLDTITCGDPDLADYLQAVAGMAALGKVFSETLLIATGDGGNGKSTFFNTLARVLGDYSTSVSPDLLLTGRGGNVGAKIAALRCVRLALAAETEEGQRLDAATVKQLCSTDKIAAEPKYKAPFTFEPSHTLVLYTNFLPGVGSFDQGAWSRLTVLPFNAHLRNADGERKDYAELLFNQAGGAVLAWIVEGARRFIADGYKLTPPAVVREAQTEYRASCDWLGGFLENCCDMGENYAAASSDIYSRYAAYCQVNGEYRRNSRDFKAALKNAGFDCKHTMQGWQFYGLRLKNELSRN